ncbi:MAG: hypothetical protein H6624_05965 [Bdellovibrionaceae bacterium]|nr:hypothetical protein [Bdellovibrionales bacterium]MCB9083868.1 hypothetical protein [Pseudobdellovibrionaceae bacterium]
MPRHSFLHQFESLILAIALSTLLISCGDSFRADSIDGANELQSSESQPSEGGKEADPQNHQHSGQSQNQINSTGVVPSAVFAEPSAQYSPSIMVDQWDHNKVKLWYCDYQLGGGTDWDQVSTRQASSLSQIGWTPKTRALSNRQLDSGQNGYSYDEGKYICDPSVIRGYWNFSFQDPQGRLQQGPFGYALYYTNNERSVENRLGAMNVVRVAFSKDGFNWHKCSDCGPRRNGRIIEPEGSFTPGREEYGVGTQVAMSTDAGSGVRMVFFEVTNTGVYRHWVRHSKDGVNFGSRVLLNSKGLDQVSLPYPAIAIAPGHDGYYYLAKVSNQYQTISIFRIPHAGLTNSKYTWQKVAQTSSVVGYHMQTEPGFLTDSYGALVDRSPKTLFFACSTQKPQSIQGNPALTWDMCKAEF